MENNNYQKELQLLPILSCTTPSYPRASPWPSDLITVRSNNLQRPSLDDGGASYPSLDLQLSIFRVQPNKPPPGTTEQMKVYAEHVMEMSRREMEMGRLEFARARHMWERALEEVERAEKMKESAMRDIGSSCMEITCQSCRKKFRPY